MLSLVPASMATSEDLVAKAMSSVAQMSQIRAMLRSIKGSAFKDTKTAVPVVNASHAFNKLQVPVLANAPPWCHALIQHQDSGSCVASFTHIGRTAKTNWRLPRDALLEAVGGTLTTTPNWMGSSGQDWWVWYNHARFMRRQGVYIDLAANDPIWRSNTYFLEACMGWRGTCIEASPIHFQRIRNERSCNLVPSCISDESGRVVHFNDGAGFLGGASGIVAKGARPRLSGRRVTMTCRTLQEVVDQHSVRHVDFLSLDIEGHELQALGGLNFSKTTVDIIIVENPDVEAMLLQLGYRKANVSAHFADSIFLRRGFRPLIERLGYLARPAEDWIGLTRCGGKVCDPRSMSCWWADS